MVHCSQNHSFSKMHCSANHRTPIEHVSENHIISTIHCPEKQCSHESLHQELKCSHDTLLWEQNSSHDTLLWEPPHSLGAGVSTSISLCPLTCVRSIVTAHFPEVLCLHRQVKDRTRSVTPGVSPALRGRPSSRRVAFSWDFMLSPWSLLQSAVLEQHRGSADSW